MPTNPSADQRTRSNAPEPKQAEINTETTDRSRGHPGRRPLHQGARDDRQPPSVLTIRSGHLNRIEALKCSDSWSQHPVMSRDVRVRF